MNSIVVPVYGNEGSIPSLLEEIAQVADRLDDELEAVFVVDGSPDRSFEVLERELPRCPFRSQLLLHSRNFGSFAAIRSGLAAAKGSFVAVMAADLQDPPDLILDFFRVLNADEADVVVGRRTGREDPWLDRAASAAFWWSFRRLVTPEVPPGGVDVFACNARFKAELLRLEESEASLVGLLFWLGFRRSEVPYVRRERKHGRSGWTFRKKLAYLFDSVFAFTDLPIKILIAAGGIGVAVSVLFGSLVVLLRLLEVVEVPGYAATVITVLFFGALNTVGIGIVGAYVWRAYGNTQRRPSAVVMRAATFEASTAAKRPGPEG